MNMSSTIVNDRTAVRGVEWLKQASTSSATSAMAKPTRMDTEDTSIGLDSRCTRHALLVSEAEWVWHAPWPCLQAFLMARRARTAIDGREMALCILRLTFFVIPSNRIASARAQVLSNMICEYA